MLFLFPFFICWCVIYSVMEKNEKIKFKIGYSVFFLAGDVVVVVQFFAGCLLLVYK